MMKMTCEMLQTGTRKAVELRLFLLIARDAGHSPSETGIRTKLMQALKYFKRERKFDAAPLEASGPV